MLIRNKVCIHLINIIMTIHWYDDVANNDEFLNTFNTNTWYFRMPKLFVMLTEKDAKN